MTTRDASRSLPEPIPDVRLRDPAGVVAAVPYLLGFVPARSLVVVGIDRDRSVGPTLRCDWRPGRDTAGTAATWVHLRQVMLRNGCSAALVLVYTDSDPDDLPPGWDRVLLDTVLDTRAEDHLDVVDVLVVGPGRFRSVLCCDSACCPVGGSPLAQAAAHPVAATFVLAGRSPAVDRESLEPEAPVADAADRAAARQAARIARGLPIDEAAMLSRWTASLPEGPEPELAGPLAAAWRARPRLRDACLAVLLGGGQVLSEQLLEPYPATPGRGWLAERLLDPACASATRTGAPVLRRLASLVSGHDRAVVLAAHAWLCWVAGEGTSAAVLAERATAEHADESLARLVLRCLSHGLGAPWTTVA